MATLDEWNDGANMAHNAGLERIAHDLQGLEYNEAVTDAIVLVATELRAIRGLLTTLVAQKEIGNGNQ